MINENRSEQHEVAPQGRIDQLTKQGRHLVAFAQMYLSFIPALPIEKPKEVHMAEDGTIVRHDDQPELVGTKVGGHSEMRTSGVSDTDE